MKVVQRLLEMFREVDEIYGHQIGGAQLERNAMLSNLRNRCDKEISRNAKGNRGEIATQASVLDKCENPNMLLSTAPLQRAYVNLKNKTVSQNGIPRLKQQEKEKYLDHRQGKSDAIAYLRSNKGHIDKRVDAYLKKIPRKSPP